MRKDRNTNDNHGVVEKNQYTYLFVTGRRVRSRSVRAIDKWDAIVKIRDLYPECLKAGVNWICLAASESTPERIAYECKSLRRLAKSPLWGADGLQEVL